MSSILPEAPDAPSPGKPTPREPARPSAPRLDPGDTVGLPDLDGPVEMPGPPEPTATPPRIGLTPSAVEQVRGMLVEEELEEAGGLRLTAQTGAGCSSPLRVGMILEVEPQEDDVILSGQGIRIFMDPRSAWALDGLRVDWVEDSPMGSGFAFHHPRRDGGRTC